MRRFVKLTGIAGALAVAACSGSTGSNDDFKKDLERASTASEIALPAAQPATQVVSSIERTTPPAPRRIAQSQRVAKHRPAPTNTPAPVEAQGADVSEEVEVAPTTPAPSPVQEVTLPSPRPQPVASTGGDYGDGDVGRGSGDVGSGIGTAIGVVLRGGIVYGDDCDPRGERDRARGRGRGATIAVNNRIPIVGTFPGSGRIADVIANAPAGGTIGRMAGGVMNSPVGGPRRGRF